jgi:spoIIIJ-associated protein
MRIIVDAEKYRVRREESIIRLARRTADQVKRSQRSRLLELMNPFERRLIHTTLNKVENIDTISEGEGLLKQVRVIYREH